MGSDFPVEAGRGGEGAPREHFVTHLVASYAAPNATGAVQIVTSAGVAYIRDFTGSLVVRFRNPLRAGPGSGVEAQLTGLPIDGHVNLVGFTR